MPSVVLLVIGGAFILQLYTIYVININLFCLSKRLISSTNNYLKICLLKLLIFDDSQDHIKFDALRSKRPKFRCPRQGLVISYVFGSLYDCSWTFY